MNFTDLFYKIAIMLVSTLATVLTGFLVSWLASKKKQVDIENGDQRNSLLINAIIDVVINTVMMLQQTVVNGLKDSNSFTKDNAEKTYEQAKKIIMNAMNEEMANAVLTVYNMDLETFIQMQIEKAVLSINE